MNKSLKLSLFALLLLVVIFSGLAIYFIAKNSSGVPTPSPSMVVNEFNTKAEANNQNTTSVTSKYTNLKAQLLIVPEIYKNGVFSDTKTLSLPEDFRISLWAGDLESPRQIDWTAGGNIIIAERGSGSIKLYQQSENGEYGIEIATIDSGLNQPSGIDYYNGDLYVGVQNEILVYKGLSEEGEYVSKKVVIADLPTGGHWSRTVRVGPDQRLYITVGSSCNICEESDQRRAAMLISNLDGSDLQVYASGLRNTVDFVFKSTSTDFKIWGVDNGRDGIGDNIPPEEVNIISRGNDYGWPYCYGSGVNNPEYPERSGYCKIETEGLTFGMQAHSAPLGLTFLVNDDLAQRVKFPQLVFNDDLFVAFHGSWDRSEPTGYKIVRINTSEVNAKEVNFITGWLDNDGEYWGRPVDVKFDQNGDMYITDDEANAIYKVEYIGVE